MITIDALGKNGASILPDLEGASPTGGFVHSEWRGRDRLRPGDLIRTSAGWAVITLIERNDMDAWQTWPPLHSAVLTTADRFGETARRFMWVTSDGAEVRTDTRVDPDTLWKLTRPVTLAG